MIQILLLPLSFFPLAKLDHSSVDAAAAISSASQTPTPNQLSDFSAMDQSTTENEDEPLRGHSRAAKGHKQRSVQSILRHFAGSKGHSRSPLTTDEEERERKKRGRGVIL